MQKRTCKELKRVKKKLVKNVYQLKDEIESDKDVQDIHKEMYKEVCCLKAQFQTRIKVQYMKPKGRTF